MSWDATYMLSSVCCQSSSCTTMLLTPYGGTVYLAEMSVLPPKVLHGFQEGNCVVKHTDRRFNQFSADQSTEWLNAIGKKSGGLVGITRVVSALSKWILSYNLRTGIASQTTAMLTLTRMMKINTMMTTHTMSAQKVGWRNTILLKETWFYR